ncbi:TetR family transcriptional regulator [Lacrimispora amygdalina]|uniref:TetR family transcriptional regulator n=1 Tax=Lacrimispora amygdalina TaxID=253257 RepID=A0A3E2ND86_9FIRM|nr:TetR/AcrR family transcriptional regulator [Clostridium indicum]RFZ78956.1 TetR/AcrR family transcriptional regulator [Clostridium indicum]
MPTERFYNLPAEKKKVICNAAIEEFTRVPFEKASINKIIKAAGISRGSFYTYFEDKRDILGYIFEDAADSFFDSWTHCAKKNDGDLWKTAVDFLEYSIKNAQKKMLKLAENIRDSDKLFGAAHNLCPDKDVRLEQMCEVLYSSIDTSDFKRTDLETFGQLISLIIIELARCISWTFHHPEDEEKIKKIFQEKLEILQYGIRKK